MWLLKRVKVLYNILFLSNQKRAIKLGVKIGRDCNIQDVSWGAEPYLIEIGNRVQITSGTKFFTHGGAWVLRDKTPKTDFFGKIKINDNVYIGNNVLIMPGVSIGSNVIIAAGSVVTKSVQNDCIVGGNPARVLSQIDSFRKKIAPFDLGTKGLDSRQKREYLLSLPDERFIQK